MATKSSPKKIDLELTLTYDYALYVMFTSYFHKCECKKNETLKRLEENYEKVGPENQYGPEELIIDKLEKDILLRPDFKDIENYDVQAEVNFSEEEQKTILTLRFNGETFFVRVTPTTYRRKPMAKIEIKKDKQKQ